MREKLVKKIGAGYNSVSRCAREKASEFHADRGIPQFLTDKDFFVRLYFLLTIIALLGCNEQKPGKVELTDSSSAHAEVALPYAPTPTDMEIDEAISGDMDKLSGALKSDTAVLVSLDASSTVDDMIEAIEENNLRRLAQYERMGWTISAPAGTRLFALHADDYPYIRIQLDDIAFGKRRGYVHKKYLVLDEKGLSLRYFTSDRGRGTEWRSR